MFIRGIIIAIITIILDQWSKYFVFDLLKEMGQFIEVTSFFNLVMVENRGVSFGLFNDHDYSAYIFSALGAGISIFLIFWLKKAENIWLSVGLGLIIGGAIGNIIDRLRFGAVADFLDFHAFGYHWPAFNIADSAIFIGAILLCLDAFMESNDKSKQEE